MKTNLLISFLIVTALNGFSQSVPNGGFENWTGFTVTLPVIGPVGYEELDGWKSANASTAALGGGSPVIKSTDSYAGNYSLQVSTIETQTVVKKDTISGLISTTFKVKDKPKSLDGYFKASLKGFKDSIGIIASVIHVDPATKVSSIIGTTVFLIEKTKPNFTDFSSPFIYSNQALSADSVTVLIISANAKKANKAPGTSVWLDELVLQYTSPLGLDQETTSAKVNLYPNPASGNVLITYNGNENAEAEILNENGQTVKKINQLNSNSINISDLEGGVYFVKVITENGSALRKLIIQ